MSLIMRFCIEVERVTDRSSLLLPLILLLLVFTSCAPTQVKDWEGVTISGKIIDDRSHPVPGSHVYAYKDGRSNTLGPADAISEPAGEDGTYVLILPEGIYTLIARWRQSGFISGPLKNGDMSGKFPGLFPAGAGHHTGVDIILRTFRHGAEGDPKRILATDTRVRGIVVDAHGRAYPGIFVFAYNGTFRQDPPDYMGFATDSEGRFEISLPGGGKYTIGARTGQRGRPGSGDSIGFWGEKDQPIEIEKGTITKGVRIVVRPYGEIDN